MTDSQLNIGVLGCGQIAQAAHFESCRKAANARLYAICDVADDLRERMAHAHAPDRAYADYDAMLADPALDAVIIATADAFHVPAAIRALEAGKHVLSEKPAGTCVEETEELARRVRQSGLVYMVGHMKRFDPGIQSARAFIDGGMGAVVALKAWYCDSTRRYAMTDAVQPPIVASGGAKRPAGDPKADRRRYYMLAHGSHLVDTARYLAGPIASVRARLSDARGMHCWFVETEFESGALGHLDLTVAVRRDWHEGFDLYGENGSILARTFNPWYFRSSEVDIFDERTGTTSRLLGEDGHFYRRQVEGFVRAIRDGGPMEGASVDDGIASMRAMCAIARSVETGERMRLADVSGAV